jgi:hypothetical protein
MLFIFGSFIPSATRQLSLLKILPPIRANAACHTLQREFSLCHGLRGANKRIYIDFYPIKGVLRSCLKAFWSTWPIAIAAGPWALWQLQARPVLALTTPASPHVKDIYQIDRNRGGSLVAHRLRVLRRFVFLLCLLTPLALSYPLTRLSIRLHSLWMWVMSRCLLFAGPAFTKWGQWAAGRPDLLPLHFRQILETLHTAAPSHPGKETLQILRESLPLPPEQLFDELEEEPFASGAVAQVHRASLSKTGADLCCRKPGEVRVRTMEQ